jgi:hypothetical protein
MTPDTESAIRAGAGLPEKEDVPEALQPAVVSQNGTEPEQTQLDLQQAPPGQKPGPPGQNHPPYGSQP